MINKCELNKEDTCEILNEKLGDCEILDEDDEDEYGYCSGWRCSHYKRVEEKQT